MRNQMKSQDEHYWLRHIECWKQSSLSQSQSAYCRQEGINSKRFHYHLHRLKNKESKPELTFIEAKAVIKSAVIKNQDPQSNIRLILPNGVQAVLEAVALDLLPQVLEVASDLSC